MLLQERRSRVLTSGRFGSVAKYRVRFIWFNANDPLYLRYSFFEDFRKIRVLLIAAKHATMTWKEEETSSAAVVFDDFTLQWRISFNNAFHIYFSGKREFEEWRSQLEEARRRSDKGEAGADAIPGDAGEHRHPTWYQEEVAKSLARRQQQQPPLHTKPASSSSSSVLRPITHNPSLPVVFVAVALPLSLGHFTLWLQHDSVTLRRIKHMIVAALHQIMHKPSQPQQPDAASSSSSPVTKCSTCNGGVSTAPSRLTRYQDRLLLTCADGEAGSHGFQLVPSSLLPADFSPLPPPPPNHRRQLVLQHHHADALPATASMTASRVWLADEDADLATTLLTTPSSSGSHHHHYCLHLVPRRDMPASASSPALSLRLVGVAREYDALSKFNVYFIQVDFGGGASSWEIKRRYSELRTLHARLKPVAVLPSETSKFFDAELNQYLFRLSMHFPCALAMLEFVGALSVASPSPSSSSSSIALPLGSIDQFVECGDVVLFRSVNPMSRMQRQVLGCTFDHVGIVVKRSRHGYELLEATGEGVTSFPLEDRIHAYSKGFCDLVAIRKTRCTRTAGVLHQLTSFANRIEGKPYKLTLGKIARGYFGGEGGEEESHTPPKREYFCSELVAEALKLCGVFHSRLNKREDYFLPHYFEPGFALDRFLAEGCWLDDAIHVVDCSRAEIVAVADARH